MAVPRSVLITGCSRGIGLELVKQFVVSSKKPEFVFACCRNPQDAHELNAVVEGNKFVKLLKLDVTKYDDYPAIVSQVSGLVGSGGLNLLINNAGVMPSEESLGQEEFVKNMMTVYETNTVVPLMFTKAFLPLLKKAATANPSADEKKQLSWARAAVVNVSSMWGSITITNDIGAYSYSASKAALNMVSKKLSHALEADKILVVSLHPGWVRTQMGGPSAPLTTKDAVEMIMKTLSQLDDDKKGLLVNTDGTVLPF